MPVLRHKRIALATEQLECALSLFLNGESYASALTLAGAAEEVLGRALIFQGKETTLTPAFQISDLINLTLHAKPLVWGKFAEQENLARNAMKHIREDSDFEIEVDLELAAISMLVRACDNYLRLDLAPTEQMNRFNQWFFENVVGT